MAYITQCLTARQKKHITEVEIVLELRYIVLQLTIFSDPSSTLKMKYNQQGNNTLVVCKNRNLEWTVENRDFLTIFVQELEEILLDPELDLERFKFLYNPSGSFELAYIREYMDPLVCRFYENLWRTLMLRKSKVNVRIVCLQARDMEQVRSFLSNIHYKSIKFIWLGMEFGNENIEIGNLVSLACNQWKYAEGLTMRMKLNLVTTNNLEEVKKLLFDFSAFDEIEIQYQRKNVQYLDHIFGFPVQLTATNTKRSKYIPITGKVLNTFDRNGSIFRCVREESSNKNALSSNVASLQNMELLSSKKSLDSLNIFENHLVMSKILKYVQCIEIQKLRKVSRRVRYIIDEIMPDAKIKKILISISSENTSVLGIQSYYSNQIKDKVYKNFRTDRLGRPVASFGYKYLEELANDIGTNLKFQKACLESLEIFFDHYLNDFRLLEHQLGTPTDIPHDYFRYTRMRVNNIRLARKFLTKTRVIRTQTENVPNGMCSNYLNTQQSAVYWVRSQYPPAKTPAVSSENKL